MYKSTKKIVVLSISFNDAGKRNYLLRQRTNLFLHLIRHF
jgi:hypothetical protein